MKAAISKRQRENHFLGPGIRVALPFCNACSMSVGMGSMPQTSPFGSAPFKSRMPRPVAVPLKNRSSVDDAKDRVDKPVGESVAGTFVLVHLFIARRRVRVILALQLYAAIEFRIDSAP